MIAPVSSYEKEFGSFFDKLERDIDGRATFLVDVRGMIYSVDQFSTEDTFEIEVSYDEFRHAAGEDKPKRLKIPALHMVEANGEYEIELSSDSLSKAVIPQGFFSEAELLLPAMIRRQEHVIARLAVVRNQLEGMYV